MKKLNKISSNMSVNVIGVLIGLMLIFGFIICLIGNNSFVTAFKEEYSTVTYHMADSASIFVNGDHIDNYLRGFDSEEEEKEYAHTKQQLDMCCQKLNVSLVYVIQVDTGDYGSFVSVFNCVNNSVDDSNYTEWELGYQRDTTNDEYRAKYQNLYQHESAYETVFRMNPPGGVHPHITTMVPIKNGSGDVTAILCMQRPIREMEEAFKPYILMIVFGVLILVAAVTVFSALFIRISIIKPVEAVSKEATRFAGENAKGEPLGRISRYEVLQNLAASIDHMETSMVQYIDDLTAFTAEKERIGAELSIAATIQENSLPDTFPAFPDRKDFDIYALMNPAKEVGGDFYNYLLIDDDHLALVMADVSGKGVPAALFMMVSNILITNRAQMGGDPAEILRFVNENVCEHNKADMFVTVWLGILELSTGKLTAANAGHEDPVICRKGGEFEILKTKHGFVIGGMPGVKYKNDEIQLNKGDKLFLYTDGLPEATDQNTRMFTLDRMTEALNRYKDKSPKEILDGVSNAVNSFVGDAPQFDDLTMLCFELRDDDNQ
ncbi:MAG: PP2C family protein-serine/threonine phosphatase [Ruminococcus sp.]|nr:PP2C family protein-serine/threonine phosphatase [Ruminococcus sp.]